MPRQAAGVRHFGAELFPWGYSLAKWRTLTAATRYSGCGLHDMGHA